MPIKVIRTYEVLFKLINSKSLTYKLVKTIPKKVEREIKKILAFGDSSLLISLKIPDPKAGEEENISFKNMLLYISPKKLEIYIPTPPNLGVGYV